MTDSPSEIQHRSSHWEEAGNIWKDLFDNLQVHARRGRDLWKTPLGTKSWQVPLPLPACPLALTQRSLREQHNSNILRLACWQGALRPSSPVDSAPPTHLAQGSIQTSTTVSQPVSSRPKGQHHLKVTPALGRGLMPVQLLPQRGAERRQMVPLQPAPPPTTNLRR